MIQNRLIWKPTSCSSCGEDLRATSSGAVGDGKDVHRLTG